MHTLATTEVKYRSVDSQTDDLSQECLRISQNPDNPNLQKLEDKVIDRFHRLYSELVLLNQYAPVPNFDKIIQIKEHIDAGNFNPELIRQNLEIFQGQIVNIRENIRHALAKAQALTGVNAQNAKITDLTGTTAGQFDANSKSIRLDQSTLNLNSLLHVLVHEILHYLNHYEAQLKGEGQITKDLDEALTEARTGKLLGDGTKTYHHLMPNISRTANALGLSEGQTLQLHKNGENERLNQGFLQSQNPTLN